MVGSPEALYLAGYQAGHMACVRGADPGGARRWIEMREPELDAAYVAGYEWAVFDYVDANGLPLPVAGAS